MLHMYPIGEVHITTVLLLAIEVAKCYKDLFLYRKQAFKEAVVSAKQKALSVANTLEVQLGPAVKVDEKPDCETAATSQDAVRQSSLPPVLQNTDPSFMPPLSLHEQLKNSTEIFTATVEVTFEVTPLRICHHHKCPKH